MRVIHNIPTHTSENNEKGGKSIINREYLI